MRTCVDCGKEFMGYPKSKRCPECQAAADKRNNAEHWRRARKGKSRAIGQMYKCEICGKEYMLTSGAQKYCPDCKESATRARDAALTREWIRRHHDEVEKRKYVARVCVICGKPIPRGVQKVTCGDPECIRARKKQQMHAADARRGIGEMPDDYVPTRTTKNKKTPGTQP